MQNNSTLYPKPGDRIACSMRVSTLAQETARQREQVTLALADLGVQIDHEGWYEDVGGKRDKVYTRPDFQRLQNDIAAGRWDWVVVDTQDRGYAAAHDFEFKSFINHALEHECNVWSIQDGCLSDPDDFAGAIKSTVNSLQSRAEQKKKSRHIMAGKIRCARQGLFAGGVIPYGLDLGIFDASGQYKWRVVVLSSRKGQTVTFPNGKKYTPRVKRFLKVTPTGSEEFSSLPAYEEADLPILIPSMVEERLQVVREVFETFAGSDVTDYRIAQTLNRRGVDPVYGEAWNAPHVFNILRQEKYAGLAVYRKETRSKYHTAKGGKVEEITGAGNKPVPTRETTEEERIVFQGQREGVVSRELWDRVAAKIAGKETRNRPPRSDRLWLKPLLRCGKCGRGMRGYNSTERQTPKYICEGYFLAKSGKPGCERCSIDHADLEPHLWQYLQDAGHELDALVGVESAESARLAGEVIDLEIAISDAAVDLECDLYNDAGKVFTGREDVGVLIATWRKFYAGSRDAIQNEVAERERELEDMTGNMLRLKHPAQIERAQMILDKKQEELDALKVRLDDTADRLEGLWSEVARRRQDLEAAREACQADGNLARTEALRPVLREIRVDFRPNPKATAGKGSCPAYLVSAVTFVPHVGVPSQRRMWVTEKEPLDLIALIVRERSYTPAA